jgi:oligopeptidase B
LNLRPNLCRAALLDVGFVDVINTMLDETIPLTREEFSQWGNPKELKWFNVMREYCPYTNLKAV